MKKSLILIIALSFGLITSVFSQNDTLRLFYKIGIHKLNTKNSQIIQSKLNNLDDDIKYHVEIISSCDFLGSNKNNLILSSKRASKVKNILLVKKNIIISSIKYKGIGELPTKLKYKSKKGTQKHRVTTIIFRDEAEHIFNEIAHSKKGAIFILKNIVFDPGRHLLKKKSIPIIKQLLKVLEDNPKLEIEINGHVCCGTNPKDSLDAYDKDTKTNNLSHNRAKHLYKYLVLEKIDSTRLRFKGHGFTQPLTYPEITETDKLNNRRVEIKVIKN